MTARTPVHVLLLEDNPADADLVQVAIDSDERLDVRLTVIEDGESGLDYLFRRGAYVSAPRPELILLDLSLPKKTGWEVLKAIKKTPELEHIPVVVVSGTDGSDDIIEAYSLRANCFITKVAGLEDGLQLIKSVLRYWLHFVRLPEAAPALRQATS